MSGNFSSTKHLIASLSNSIFSNFNQFGLDAVTAILFIWHLLPGHKYYGLSEILNQRSSYPKSKFFNTLTKFKAIRSNLREYELLFNSVLAWPRHRRRLVFHVSQNQIR